MVEAGFKLTEVGVIPNDWEVKFLSQFSDIQTGSTPPVSDKTNYGDDYFFVTPADLGKGRLIKNSERKLSNKGFKLSRRFPKDSILFTCIGSTIGKSGIANQPLTSNQQINSIFPNPKFDSNFLFYVLNLFSAKIKESAGETAVPILNKTDFGEIKIPFPKKIEQTAIATALNDADTLIVQLEKVIAKKRVLKQGAMQQLLQSKEGWEVKKLVQVVDYIHGKAHERFIDENGTYIVINSKFVSSDGTVIKSSNVNFCPAKKNDIVTVLSDLPNGKALAKCFYVEVDDKYAVNQRICIWRTRGANSKLLYYILNRNKYFLSLNDGISQTHILNSHIHKCEISIPKDKSEQVRIATILSDMDAEIEAFEEQLKKYREIKQGMMQVLLTGKVRLVGKKEKQPMVPAIPVSAEELSIV